jgi:nucleotide-binding universal stress UspA family protein
MAMDRADPVMVGIDGSTASVRAAVWAADEAAARDTTLDLLYVIDPTAVEDLDDAMATARHAIHRAWEAVTASDRHVKLESEILQGNPVIELANAARRGALICVGHKGTKDSAPKERGSTASSLARISPASVAVVRRRHTHRRPSFHRWVVTIVDESAESHAVLQAALDEAALREAPVLALTTWSTALPRKPRSSEGSGNIRAKLDSYLKEAQDNPADVQVCVLSLPADLTRLLEQSASIEQLFVIGSNRHDLVDQMTGAQARKAMRGTNCSVLIVHIEPLADSSTSADETSVTR